MAHRPIGSENRSGTIDGAAPAPQSKATSRSRFPLGIPRRQAEDLVLEEAHRALAELEAGRKPRFGDPNEAAQRQTITERLAAIEERLAAPAPAKIGHNHPPEPIEADQASTTAEVRDASRAISQEVAKSKPDVAEVARRTTVLAGVARRLRAAGGGIADFGKRVKDKAQDKAAELVATTLVGGGCNATAGS